MAKVIGVFTGKDLKSKSKEFLEDMNREFQKEYGLKVMPNKTTGKPFVADLEGNKVRTKKSDGRAAEESHGDSENPNIQKKHSE